MRGDDAVTLARQLRAQLLSGSPAAGPVAVAERLLAVQAQDPRGVRLAIRARTSGLTASALERELTDTRRLVINWLNRGTLHLVRSEDHSWLHALTAPGHATATARRLAQLGVTPAQAERGVVTIERSLANEGPLTRGQLRARLDAKGVPTAGQALVHLLALASVRGLIVRGPIVGTDQAFAHLRGWLGEPPAFDRDRALAELARRYLAGHGPASDRDLARWAGVGLRDARRGLSAIAASIHVRADGTVELAGAVDATELPAPRLLGAFDPVLLGWVSRTAILGGHSGVVTVNGIFRPIALVDGRAVGTWRLRGGAVEPEPFTRLKGSVTAALRADAADVLRYLAG